MKMNEYRFLIFSDLYRITGDVKVISLILLLIRRASFRFNFWIRTCQYAESNWMMKYSLYPFARYVLYRLRYKYGISIPYDTTIGSGFYIGHFGGIVVNNKSIIGKNCNISHGVTLGQANRGRNKGAPTLGDNIYIGPGAKIIGAVTIGNNVAIGANCVVTKSVPDNSVVVGIPAKVISQNGSQGYIDRVDYENVISRCRATVENIKM